MDTTSKRSISYPTQVELYNMCHILTMRMHFVEGDALYDAEIEVYQLLVNLISRYRASGLLELFGSEFDLRKPNSLPREVARLGVGDHTTRPTGSAPSGSNTQSRQSTVNVNAPHILEISKKLECPTERLHHSITSQLPSVSGNHVPKHGNDYTSHRSKIKVATEWIPPISTALRHPSIDFLTRDKRQQKQRCQGGQGDSPLPFHSIKAPEVQGTASTELSINAVGMPTIKNTQTNGNTLLEKQNHKSERPLLAPNSEEFPPMNIAVAPEIHSTREIKGRKPNQALRFRPYTYPAEKKEKKNVRHPVAGTNSQISKTATTSRAVVSPPESFSESWINKD